MQLDITVGETRLDDQFEWDIENVDPTAEQFTEIYSADLGLAGEFKLVFLSLFVLLASHHAS